MIEEYNKHINDTKSEIENLNCSQLTELLKVKEQQLRNVLNDIKIFDKFITDLSKEKTPKALEHERALEALETAEIHFARAFENLDRCSLVGETCDDEVEFFTEANDELKEAKRFEQIILKQLKRILDEIAKYSELRSNAYADRRRLRSEIFLIRRKMEALGC